MSISGETHREIRPADIVIVACHLAWLAGQGGDRAPIEPWFHRAQCLLETSARFQRDGAVVLLSAVQSPDQLAIVTKAIEENAGGGSYDWLRLIDYLEGLRRQRKDRKPNPIKPLDVMHCLVDAEGREYAEEVQHLLDGGRFPAARVPELIEKWSNYRRRRTDAALRKKSEQKSEDMVDAPTTETRHAAPDLSSTKRPRARPKHVIRTA